MKANVFLREKGLNCDFALKSSGFKGTLLELLNEFNSVSQVKNGNTVKLVKVCLNENCSESVKGVCLFKIHYEHCTSKQTE